MESSGEVLFHYGPFLRVYKDGRFERDLDPTTGYLPPRSDPSSAAAAGVISKDVIPIPGGEGRGARLFLPADTAAGEKLPIVIYFHGGGFFIGSPYSPFVHNNVENIVKNSRAVAVAVGYRLVPEHPLPSAYEDCYAAFKWVAGGDNCDEWLKNHGDFNKIIVAGDSAGANIAHNVLMLAGKEGTRVSGMALNFLISGGVKDAKNNDDFRINPMAKGAPGLEKIGCRRAVVMVAEHDALCARGKAYAEALRRSGWDGEVELVEYDGEDHCFHAGKPETLKAKDVMDRLVKFINC